MRHVLYSRGFVFCVYFCHHAFWKKRKFL